MIYQKRPTSSGHGPLLRVRFCAGCKQVWQVLGSLAMAGLTAHATAQTLPAVVSQALQAYPSILSASAKTAAARSDIARARSAHYPQLGVTATANTYASSTPLTPSQRLTWSPTTRLNLWSGGKIEADTQRSEALTRAAESQQANTLEDVAQQAAEAYLNWAKTADLYNLAVRNVNSHRETLEDIRKIAEVDKGRRVDYEQALVRMENATLTLQQRKSDFSQAIQRMTRYWSGPLDARPTGLDEVVSNVGPLGRMPLTMAGAMDMVSNDLPVIAQALAQVQAAEAAVRMAKGQHWPTVDVAISRQAATATSREEVLTQLQLNAPLYSGGSTSAAVEAAQGQLKSAQFALDEARLVAREKAALAWQEWASAQSRSITGNAQSDVGDKLVESYRQQFRVARRSLLELLNMQADAFGYRSSARTAFHDERIARVRLLASTGDLARRFTSEPGLVVQPGR
ncbi:TolC family protein [Limnohabitans sp. T6-5]|uniref:TolC family protein n=1 Tax=Limnohabitans sp. T6-5 TaxID=1100724 RepID=UPI001304D768|nr:TolC family protein [Limnohabitans sp. T6-5]